MLDYALMRRLEQKVSAVNTLLEEANDPFTVELKALYKQNLGEQPALILKPINDDLVMSPIIYYEPQMELMSDAGLASYLEQIYEDRAKPLSSDEYPDLSREGILKNVLPRVLSADHAVELDIHDMLYTRLRGFTDLVASYYVPELVSGGTITITQDLADTALLTSKDLQMAAERNVVACAEISSLGDAIRQMGAPDTNSIIEGTPGLWIATLAGGALGAGVLAGGEVMLRHMAEAIGSDEFFILPSSIHEVLLLNDDGCYTFESLLDMVESVNSSIVAPEDRLTDNVYHYSVSTNRIVHCK